MNLAELGPLISVVVPIIVAAVGGWFGYRQAVKVADRTSSVEGRKLTLAEYESLNRGLQAEIDRLRGDRNEDEERFERRTAGLETRIDRMERQRTDAEAALTRLIGWARAVLVQLGRPDVARALDDLDCVLPDLPDLPGFDQLITMQGAGSTRGGRDG